MLVINICIAVFWVIVINALSAIEIKSGFISLSERGTTSQQKSEN